MPQQARQRFTFGEYVRLEDYSNLRHEFLDGVIYAMAGGTPRHAALAARLIRTLGPQLVGKNCEVFTSDLRVRVTATGLATYPDVTIVCGSIETDPEDASTIVNPVAIAEVLSDSSEEYDRGEKLDHYRKIASVQEILLVSHREPRIEVWRRDVAGHWSETIASGRDRVELPSIGCNFLTDDLYRDLPPEAKPNRSSG